ncbi:MAG: hypothetical protein ACRDYF_12020 [Acidimicrobiia bacterium]
MANSLDWPNRSKTNEGSRRDGQASAVLAVAALAFVVLGVLTGSARLGVTLALILLSAGLWAGFAERRGARRWR